MKKIAWSTLLCAQLLIPVFDVMAQPGFKDILRSGTDGRLTVWIAPPKTGPLNFSRFTFSVSPPADERSHFFGEKFFRAAKVTNRFKSFYPSGVIREKIESDMIGFGAQNSAAAGPNNINIATSCEVFYPDLRGFIWYRFVVKVRLAIKATLHDSTLFERKYEKRYITSGLDWDWTGGLILREPYGEASAAMSIALRKTLDDFYRDLNWTLNNNIIVSGTVADARTNTPLKANVLFKSDTAYLQTSRNGRFTATLPTNKDYDCKVSAPGYVSVSRRFSAEDLKDGSRHLDFTLEPIEVSNAVNLKNVEFHTGTADLIEQSYSRLQEVVSFLKDNPTIKIELEGHTDLGDTKRNLKLSKERADKIKLYLVSHGISSRRIREKAFGDAQPLSTTDNLQAHERNRRVEFTILER